ncbi:fused response regulator/phosphatase [Pedobacter sp. SD-b]|uniref:Fused response regulator/phosphatase n=1 Tax=Pedobacter segetis TaxID=2793069 RepID=A0ABS1BFT2_9SPHI|nr:fused response regulator/phosphatase [Pedobacter segetis]MBK0381719.1 fused response regulator/phosphatase [Pedobacter segetis]
MKKKILVVDDELIQLVLLQKVLENAGFMVNKAQSVLDAMDILKDDLPDLIISDLEMDQLDGFEFKEILLNSDKYHNIPFLFLTAHNKEVFIEKGLSLKAIDYIPKGIPKEQLIAKINNILETVKDQKEQSVNELKMVADRLNLKNVPSKNLKFKNFQIDIFHQTYQNHPGGDFIDLIKIDERYTFLVLGDVMGKKWGAWFFSFTFLSYIRSAIRLCVFDGNLSVAKIMQRINQVIHADDFLDDIYSTLSLVLIDDEKGELTYSGASDLPLLKYKNEDKKINQYKSKGLLLGFFEVGNFNEQVIQCIPKDQLFLLSDGVIDYEANGVKKTDINLFISQLENLLSEEKTFDEITSNIFNKEKYQVDDCSLIQIKRI